VLYSSSDGEVAIVVVDECLLAAPSLPWLKVRAHYAPAGELPGVSGEEGEEGVCYECYFCVQALIQLSW